MIACITPKEVKEKRLESIPDQVIEAFNELIVKNWTGYSSIVSQKDAIALICSKMDVSRDVVYNQHWLDVEPLFEKAGWKVKYDKPAYNESYEATFEFTKRPVRSDD